MQEELDKAKEVEIHAADALLAARRLYMALYIRHLQEELDKTSEGTREETEA